MLARVSAMVKLTTARESRTYGHLAARDRLEYINAGLYVLAPVLLVGGFTAQLSAAPAFAKSGLALALIGLALVLVVNAHDLVAHLAGVDFCLSLVEFDVQLALVEFSVPLAHIVGTILNFIGILFFLIQMEKRYSPRLESHAVNTLISGPIFWVIGSIHNICQVYETANGHVQILQKCVQVPLLMGSLLFLVAGILNNHDTFGSIHTTSKIMGKSWVWLCLSGSCLFFVGGLLNVVKVSKMQRRDGVRLEKLRGTAHESSARRREGQLPLILESSRRKKAEEVTPVVRIPASTPPHYKAVP
ncbi:uncharacterized protein LOC103999697 [Musa acuminata AAA Group]|uniref:uncharacterized protein LOC103999697 n=1 Tax=Musa acuminata AAA Group TaxID=214697 RepID=UPI0031DE9666